MKEYDINPNSSLFDESSQAILETIWHNGLGGVYLYSAIIYIPKFEGFKASPKCIAELKLEEIYILLQSSLARKKKSELTDDEIERLNVERTIIKKNGYLKKISTLIHKFLPYLPNEGNYIAVPLFDDRLNTSLETCSYTPAEKKKPVLYNYPNHLSIDLENINFEFQLFDGNATIKELCSPFFKNLSDNEKLKIRIRLNKSLD